MNMNLKTIVLALVAGLTFAVSAEKPACASKMGEPAPAPEPAAETQMTFAAVEEAETSRVNLVSMPV